MPGVNFHCPQSQFESIHCECWYECQPCCWCRDDTEDMDCDCMMHPRNWDWSAYDHPMFQSTDTWEEKERSVCP